VISIETQVHGYRQGHQLIASSLSLSKPDQAVIDRLSDVAGPLRPGERFDPYLSGYPLPSEAFFVLARTWQDLAVPRAGCVRTLSLLIPMRTWETVRGLQPFLDMLDPAIFPSDASPLSLPETAPAPLPEAPAFRASELLEAIFLEEPKPVALFDAPDPELIAVRLLTALWPALRRRFALSTFALSPRKIEGRGFDLIFAPKDARPKFANWPGRRIDARAGQGARHRWTGEIVERVFRAPFPWLLSEAELALIGLDESATPAAVRIALLWDELLTKLAQSPSAALGLLDIAKSKMQSDSHAVLTLQPVLVDAAQRAAASLPPTEAWDLIGAMVRKMHGTRLDGAFPAVATASATLARKAPAAAISFLDQNDSVGAVARLAPAIAAGLADHFDSSAEKALCASKPATFARLIAADQDLAQTAVARAPLLERLADGLSELDAVQFASVRDAVLDFVVNDQQIALARPLIGSLDKAGLLVKVRRLADANTLGAQSFLPLLAARARETSATSELRDALLAIAPSPGRNQLIGLTLRPVAKDVQWLLTEPRLGGDFAQQLLYGLLRAADTESFRRVMAHADLTPALVGSYADGAHDLLGRAVHETQLPLDLYVTAALRLLPLVSTDERHGLARQALDRCLRDHFPGKETATLTTLLGALGARLDGTWAVRRGLARGVAASVVSRNLLAFNQAPKLARQRILEAVFEIAQTLAARASIDLDEPAADACAQLFWDAQSVNQPGVARGAGKLLPALLRAGRAPISALVASTFPLVYLELAKEDDVPDILKFVPFFDWDRCKAARRELVDAFLSAPAWRPRDLALTACRAGDVGKILRGVGKAHGGDAYMNRLTADTSQLPGPCRDKVKRTIAQIRSDWSAKHRWRD
jgi:GTPase-associated protein 1, N-terminal domain type 1